MIHCYKGLVPSRGHHVGLRLTRVRLTCWIFCVGLCAYVIVVTYFQYFFLLFFCLWTTSWWWNKDVYIARDHASILHDYWDMDYGASNKDIAVTTLTFGNTWSFDPPSPNTLPWNQTGSGSDMTGCWDMVIWNSSRKDGRPVGHQYSWCRVIILGFHFATLGTQRARSKC